MISSFQDRRSGLGSLNYYPILCFLFPLFWLSVWQVMLQKKVQFDYEINDAEGGEEDYRPMERAGFNS